LRLVPHHVVFEVELVTVVDDVGAGRHGHKSLPAIVHHQGRAHFVEFRSHVDVGLDAVPSERLLPGVEGDLDRIKVVGVAHLALGRQVGERGATGQQQRHE